MISLINSERAGQGLTTLCSHGGLTDFARGHTADMIAEGTIFHSSNLGSAASGWTAMGENVGMGPNVSVLHNAFMNSSGHRANILGDYTHIGVGIDLAPNGTMFVTVVFMKAPGCSNATTTTTAPPATTTTTAPPATTTTTAPPATTTTTAAPTPTTTATPTTTTTTAAPTTTSTPGSATTPTTLADAPSFSPAPVLIAPMFCRAIAYDYYDGDMSCVD